MGADPAESRARGAAQRLSAHAHGTKSRALPFPSPLPSRSTRGLPAARRESWSSGVATAAAEPLVPGAALPRGKHPGPPSIPGAWPGSCAGLGARGQTRGNFDSREFQFPPRWLWEDRHSLHSPSRFLDSQTRERFALPASQRIWACDGENFGDKEGVWIHSRPLLHSVCPFGPWNGVGCTLAADGQWRLRDLKSRSSPLPSSPLSARRRPTPEDSCNLPNRDRLWEDAPLAEQGALCGSRFTSSVPWQTRWWCWLSPGACTLPCRSARDGCRAHAFQGGDGGHLVPCLPRAAT